MGKKKKSPPSKRDGDNACGAYHYAKSIFSAIDEVKEMESMLEADPVVPIERIPILIRVHTIGSDGVCEEIRTAPILSICTIDGKICLGTYEHLLTKEKSC